MLLAGLNLHNSIFQYLSFCSLFACSVTFFENAFFAEEEINAMKQALDKYGIAMPAFGKIGGLLAGEVNRFSSF